ncbi:MAG TPA: hypothetical protein VMF50_12150 [Candidatus Binataceae bacterium]|nr:hypothetical protein [Candidatus Binataceae bacterium]
MLVSHGPVGVGLQPSAAPVGVGLELGAATVVTCRTTEGLMFENKGKTEKLTFHKGGVERGIVGLLGSAFVVAGNEVSVMSLTLMSRGSKVIVWVIVSPCEQGPAAALPVADFIRIERVTVRTRMEVVAIVLVFGTLSLTE